MLLSERCNREFALLEIHQELVEPVGGGAREVIRKVITEIATGSKSGQRIAGDGILVAPVSVVQGKHQVLLAAVELEDAPEGRLVESGQLLGGNRHRIVPSALGGITDNVQPAGRRKRHLGRNLVGSGADAQGVGGATLVVVSVRGYHPKIEVIGSVVLETIIQHQVVEVLGDEGHRTLADQLEGHRLREVAAGRVDLHDVFETVAVTGILRIGPYQGEHGLVAVCRCRCQGSHGSREFRIEALCVEWQSLYLFTGDEAEQQDRCQHGLNATNVHVRSFDWIIVSPR